MVGLKIVYENVILHCFLELNGVHYYTENLVQ